MALDALSGEVTWEYKANRHVDASPSIADGKVFIGSGDGTFYVLNATNGSLEWSYPIGGEITSSAAISGGLVFVGSTTGGLYAFHDPNATIVDGDTDDDSVDLRWRIGYGIVSVLSFIGVIFIIKKRVHS